jgi:DNA (cytosine-5)-methyltransferase 1
MLWFTKGRRAQSDTDYETWIEGGVMPTLNSFDNGDVRTTIIIFHPHYHDGARIQGDTMNTLTSRMGTGGNNVSMVATFPIQGTIIGRSDTAGPQGKGFGDESDPMYTLDSVSGHGVATQSNVRRLTPTECERLQGFPDGWTDEQTDSHRYKQMGNAVTVNVAEWIFNRVSDTIGL